MKLLLTLFHNIFSISLTSGVKLHIHLWNVVVRFIFFSILQIWYVKVRISLNISESPFLNNESGLCSEMLHRGLFSFPDLGSGGESVKKLETKIFVGNTATNTAKTELIQVGQFSPFNILADGILLCFVSRENILGPVVQSIVSGQNSNCSSKYNI